MAKKKRPKRVHVTRIPQYEDGRAVKAEPYVVLDHAVGHWHPHLVDARIALAWRSGLKPDKDGRLVLGKCKKASDLDRELAKDVDAVILLNEGAWGTLSREQRLALVDHELSHLAVVTDDQGEPKRDERGRICYRLRKHDLEEFRAVVSRHGCYLDDIREFVAAAQEAPLFAVPMPSAARTTPAPAIVVLAELPDMPPKAAALLAAEGLLTLGQLVARCEELGLDVGATARTVKGIGRGHALNIAAAVEKFQQREAS